MRGEEAKGNDVNGIEALCASENAEDDVVDLLGRAQEEAPLDGAAGDLDEGPAFGHETKMSAHAPRSVGKRGSILSLDLEIPHTLAVSLREAGT